MQTTSCIAFRREVPVAKPLVAKPVKDLAAVECQQCRFSELCLGAKQHLYPSVTRKVRRLSRGDHLYRGDEAFVALFSVRSGSFKTQVTTANGLQQVLGFQMAGDVLGMDGISQGAHFCGAIALEDSTVCVFPFAELQYQADMHTALWRTLYKLVGHEIVRDQRAMFLLGSLSAQERLIAFLLELSRNMRRRGFSESCLQLRMTREDIGSYLGLSLETVSRLFSKLHAEGLLQVSRREIRIPDPTALLKL